MEAASHESLRAAYRQKTDAELVLLAAQSGSLTEIARGELSAEMQSRGLVFPKSSSFEQRRPGGSSASVSHGRWNWIWPNVGTLEGATWATKQAFWAAVLCVAVTGAFALLGAFGVRFVQAWGIDASALVDSAIFAAIAFGLWRHSRAAAWAGLVLYGAERAYMWGTVGIKNPVIAAIFILAFIGGVRGTSALHRLEKAKIEQPQSGAA